MVDSISFGRFNASKNNLNLYQLQVVICLPADKLTGMKTVTDIRKKNLAKLANRYETQRIFADSLDMSPAQLNHLLCGHRNIGEKLARKIENQLRLEHLFLDKPTGILDAVPPIASSQNQNAQFVGDFDAWASFSPLKEDEVEVPFLIESKTDDSQEVRETICSLRFSKQKLAKASIKPEDTFCIKVSGDSMAPVLPDNTTAGVDTARTEVIDGELYALDHAGNLRVRMLYKIPGGGLRLRAFNSDAYPDEIYKNDEARAIRVIGRVFWYSVLR